MGMVRMVEDEAETVKGVARRWCHSWIRDECVERLRSLEGEVKLGHCRSRHVLCGQCG